MENLAKTWVLANPNYNLRVWSVSMLSRFYIFLERWVPGRVKSLVPAAWRIKLGQQIKEVVDTGLRGLELEAPLDFPAGEDEASLLTLLKSSRIKEDRADGPRERYLSVALRRFIYTLALVPDQEGKLLEIGAGPYFLTHLLERFRAYELSLINFFGEAYGERGIQTLMHADGREQPLAFDNVNVEYQPLPYADATFDVVLLCEVLEHFVNDPLHAMKEISRVLKPGGRLVLTTPNVNNVEHIARLLSGHNIFHPYSGFGPAGRHNREYTVAELKMLLTHTGFEVEHAFTSDIHHNQASHYTHVSQFKRLLRARKGELGQYIFTVSRRVRDPKPERPVWLFSDYPDLEQ